MAKLTKKKAGEILTHLPSAFEEIQEQNRWEQHEPDLPLSKDHAELVGKHYRLTESRRNSLFSMVKNQEANEEGYSNACACFGAHMHVEIWLASFKAKCTEPEGLNDFRHAKEEYGVYWGYRRGAEALHELLLKFPKYRKWLEDNKYSYHEYDPDDKGFIEQDSNLAVFLNEECGAPYNPFGGSDWDNTTPVEVLTNLNDWLGIETVKA